jgi:aspartate aminotransferase
MRAPMVPTNTRSLDLTPYVADSGRPAVPHIGQMAQGLVGSEILKIASEIRAMTREGKKICNLTVGDFAPRQFPIPERLRGAIIAAYQRGETNYPPSNGVLELREAVTRYYERELGLRYPVSSTLITAGARPVIYATYRALVDPGDRVVYPLPSWNNNHYVHLVGATGVAVPCRSETRFLPTREDVLGALPSARLLCINSPLNPTGTAIEPSVLRGICEAILDENKSRERRRERPLFLMYDHIYWQLCVGDTEHVTPPGLLPEMARYTIFVDGISKSFAATGLRVGWAVGPTDIVERMSAILGHVGAWAPRAEQIATTALLDDGDATRDYIAWIKDAISRRLHRLHDGLQDMKAQGLPVDSLPPMGTIYLTARLEPFGRRTPAGTELRTNEDIRRYLLDAAGFGAVPFQAFGVPQDDGWFRLSVGAVGLEEIDAALPRLEAALKQLR